MPQHIEGREGQIATLGGVPFVISHSRGGRWRGFAATFDSDGLLETADDLRKADSALRKRLDDAERKGKDGRA